MTGLSGLMKMRNEANKRQSRRLELLPRKLSRTPEKWRRVAVKILMNSLPAVSPNRVVKTTAQPMVTIFACHLCICQKRFQERWIYRHKKLACWAISHQRRLIDMLLPQVTPISVIVGPVSVTEGVYPVPDFGEYIDTSWSGCKRGP